MKRLLVLSLTMVSVTLTGCLGSSNRAPDEMSVIDGAPLSLPPNFELRPPQKGKTVDRVKQNEESRRLLLGTMSEKKEEAKTTEGWLVQQAGGDKRDEEIRTKLESEDEKALEKEADKGFFSKLFSNDKKDAARAAQAAKEEAAAAAKAEEEAEAAAEQK